MRIPNSGYLYVFMFLICSSCEERKIHDNSPIVGNDSPVSLTNAEIRYSLFSMIERSFELRLNGNWKELQKFFHPLEWETLEHDYPDVGGRQQILQKMGSDYESFQDYLMNYGYTQSITMENILDSARIGSQLIYLINYRYEVGNDIDRMVNQNQLICFSGDSGNHWSYYRVDKKNCNKTRERLIEYFSSNSISGLLFNICQVDKTLPKTSSFLPSTDIEEQIVNHFNIYTYNMFEGDFNKAMNYLPSEVFDVIKEDAGESVTRQRVIEIMREQMPGEFKDIKIEEFHLHKLMKSVKAGDTYIFLFSYSVFFDQKGKAAFDYMEMGGKLAVIYNSLDNTYMMFEFDDDLGPKIINRMFPGYAASINDYEYSK